MIMTAESDVINLACHIHIKNLGLPLCQVFFSEKVMSLAPLQKRFRNVLHSIHTIKPKLLAVVGVKIIIAAVPIEGKGADNQFLSALGIGFGVLSVW